MAHIRFAAHLQRHLPCPDLEVEGTTVADALGAAFAREPRLRTYIVDDQGRLRRHVALFVNEQMIRDRGGLTDPLGPTDRLFVAQALSGG